MIFDKNDPLEAGWLQAFIKHCEEEDLKSFAQGINAFLKDNDEVKNNSGKVWHNLLLPYMDQRISGKPKILCKAEFSWMLEWCLNLDDNFSDCVEKIIEADRIMNLIDEDSMGNSNIMYKISESDIFKNNTDKAGEFVLHLLSKKHISLWDWDYLEEIIKQLTHYGCDSKYLNGIIESALDIGFREAETLKNK